MNWMRLFILLTVFGLARAQCPDTLWSRLYQQTGVPTAFLDADALPTGGYVLCGYRGFHLASSVWLTRVDSLGVTLWTRTFGGPAETNNSSNALDLCSDGSYFLTGWRGWGSYRDPDDSSAVYVLKVAANGDTLWTRTFGYPGTGRVVGWDGHEVSTGGFIVCGATNHMEHFWVEQRPGADSSDMFLLRLDENGDSLWFRTYGGDLGDEAFAVLETDDGGFVITGPSRSFTDTSHSDVVLLKTDSDGNQEWLQTYGHPGVIDVSWAITQTADNGFLLAGDAEIAPGSESYVIRTDTQSNQIWHQTYRHFFSSMTTTIVELPDGDFVIGISSLPAIGSLEIYLLRGGLAGDFVRGCTYLLPGTQEQRPYVVLRRADGNYAVAGSTYEPNDSAFLLLTEVDPLKVRGHSNLPQDFALSIYPNPFNSQAQVQLDLPYSGLLSVNLFNLQGQLIAQLVHQHLPAGNHTIAVDGQAWASGIYFLRADFGGLSQTLKLMLLK